MTERRRRAKFCAEPRTALGPAALHNPIVGTRPVKAGAAAVELALVLPFLLTVFVVSVDFARVFYSAQVIADCARTAALFAANPDLADKTSHESAQALALQYVKDLKPQPTVTFTTGTDCQSHRYVEVTVSHNFRLICPFAFRSNYQLTRSARARLFPAALEESDCNG